MKILIQFRLLLKPSKSKRHYISLVSVLSQGSLVPPVSVVQGSQEGLSFPFGVDGRPFIVGTRHRVRDPWSPLTSLRPLTTDLPLTISSTDLSILQFFLLYYTET